MLQGGGAERDELTTSYHLEHASAPAARAAHYSGRGSQQRLAPSIAAASNAGLIWQGFHWTWLRKVLGFETPHRLGSAASQLTNFSSNCTPDGSPRCAVGGTYGVQFSPGVDGDYAFPKVYYTGVVSRDGSLVRFLFGNWSFSFTDTSTADPVPHADTALLLNATIALPTALDRSQTVSVSLQGFSLAMECIESTQHTCNSNATWTYYFNVSLVHPCSISLDRKVRNGPIVKKDILISPISDDIKRQLQTLFWF